jgi:cytochrome d ubiquinol oxidase subunit I
MDATVLARLQFAFTVGFHFLFPPVTIGMSWLITGLLWKWKRTGDDLWRRTARFWLKLFAITFAVGVATGITMEFQFGTNWAAYSRFVGDIFGAPLAAEGIFSFFLESTFLGVLLFGFDRFSRGTLVFAGLMVAVGSTLSAFWIIAANSWMQTPAGFHIVAGRAELTDFWAAVFNPSLPPRYAHSVVSALVTGSFFVTGISAALLLGKRHLDVAKASLRVALIVAFCATLVQLGTGHWHGMQVAATQPAKFAATEALFETQRGAPLVAFGIPDSKHAHLHAAVEIPGLLSWMATADSNAEIRGLNSFPRDEWPPVGETFWSFRMMIGLWFWFLGLSGLGMILLWRRRLFENRFFLRLAMLTIPLPFLANELGWFVAEVGRQPWVVYGVLRTRDAVSPNVPAGSILFSLILFGAIYALLFFVWIYLLRRAVKKGPEPAAEPKPEGGAP